jgi:uncharacterized protein YbbC (DUF1343 family)
MISTGLEVFLAKNHQKYRKLRLGVLCNQASVDRKLSHISDLVLQKKLKLDVTCFIGPQHGVRGEKQDNMVESDDFVDPRHGLPVFSLYGATREPTAAMLDKIDAFVIDLQDIGTRIYTFMYTMANCMRAAKAAGKKVIVLDRPNPIGGVLVEGNVLESGFTSFVGQYPMATRHGMTMGELALLFNEAYGIGCDLDIVEVKGWKRPMDADTWGRDWVPPSPNIPNLTSALTFPGTVHFEGIANVSEGRGTTKPFEFIGAPFAKPDALADEMNRKKLPGVFFRAIYFQPTYQKGKDQVLGGVQIHVTNRKLFQPFRAGIELLAAFYRQGKDGSFQWKQPPYEYEHDRMPIDLIAGSSALREELEKTGGAREFLAKSRAESEGFKKLRRKFLIY